jgi:hypothetical protein
MMKIILMLSLLQLNEKFYLICCRRFAASLSILYAFPVACSLTPNNLEIIVHAYTFSAHIYLVLNKMNSKRGSLQHYTSYIMNGLEVQLLCQDI